MEYLAILNTPAAIFLSPALINRPSCVTLSSFNDHFVPSNCVGRRKSKTFKAFSSVASVI